MKNEVFEKALYGEIYFENENGEVEADFGFDGWYIFFPERKILFVLIPETDNREEEEKYIEQIEKELKKDNVLPEGYNIVVCHPGSVYNVGTLADNLDDL